MDDIPSTLECLLTPHASDLPIKVQTIYVHTIIKIYAYWTSELISQWNMELQHEFTKVTQVMCDKMDMFIKCKDLEVQERAHNVKSLFQIILNAIDATNVEAPLVLAGLPELFFMYELNPVAPKAQSKVPVPEGLDLDAWINEPLPDLVDDFDSDNSMPDYEKISKTVNKKKKKSHKSKHEGSEDEEEKERVSLSIMLNRLDTNTFLIASCCQKRSS